MDITPLIDELIRLSYRAGEAILDIYSGADLGTTFKESDGSPLTKADKASHDVIIEGLERSAPEIPVLSEESSEVPYDVRKNWKRFWLIDPLDGTKEFIKRNGEFTVNIALIEDQRPVFGIVYAPVLGVAYYGAKGSGAFKIKEDKKEAIKASDYRAGLKIVGSRSHGGAEADEFIKRLGPAEFVSMGSSLKFCLIAEGSAHLYPRFGPTMEWDTAAAQAVVDASGGHVTDSKGEPLCYNKEKLLNPFFMAAGNPPFPWKKYLDESARA